MRWADYISARWKYTGYKYKKETKRTRRTGEQILQNINQDINIIPKVALFHDISSFGRCALSVIIPIIAALKVQPIAIPTALLSTHTGGFTNYSFADLTEEMKKIIAHHNELNIKFDAVYSGFLGSNEQIKIISDFIKKQKEKNALVFIDPVMADEGELYSSYSDEMKKNMINLIQYADVITPNITEAFFLLDMPFQEPPYNENFVKNLFSRLMDLNFGLKSVIITSIELENSGYGVAYKEKGKEIKYKFTNKYDADYPGSGDIFSSVVCGYTLNGYNIEQAISAAVEYISTVIGYTMQCGTPVREGLAFEKFLGDLKI